MRSTPVIAPVADPWAVRSPDVTTGAAATDVPNAEGPADRPAHLGAAALAAAGGAAGPVIALSTQGFLGRAAVLLALAAAWEVLLRLRRGVIGWVVLAVFAVVAVVACRSTMGRAPAVVALVGVAVADAALVDWRPLPRWPRRRTAIASLAVAPLAVAQVAWARSWGSAATMALLGSSLVIVELYHRYPSPAAVADGGWRRALTGIGLVAGRLVVLPVAVVVLYLPGAIVEWGWARRSRRRRAGWSEPRIGRADQHRDADRPFATTTATAKRSRLIVGFVVLALLVGVIVVERRMNAPGTDAVDASSGATGAPDVFQAERDVRFSDLPAYEGVDWADELKDEQDRLTNEHLRPAAVGGVDLDDFEGRFTNVADRVRSSLPPPACAGCPVVRLWFAGGSAAFGLGQRDDHTVASELVRLAADDGLRLEVSNLGVPGWTIVQEAQKVLARLSTSAPRPDVVVFYDGFDDVVGALMAAAVHGIDPSAPNTLDVGDIQTVSQQDLDLSDAGTASELGDLAAMRYLRVRDQVSPVLEAVGATPVFALQPDALASERQLRAVIGHFPTSGEHVPFARRVFRVAQRRLARDGVDLRDVFDDERTSVYADLADTNERGARIVAEELYPSLRDALTAAGAKR